MDGLNKGDILWNPRTQDYFIVTRANDEETVYIQIFPHDSFLQTFWRKILKRMGRQELPSIKADDKLILAGRREK